MTSRAFISNSSSKVLVTIVPISKPADGYLFPPSSLSVARPIGRACATIRAQLFFFFFTRSFRGNRLYSKKVKKLSLSGGLEAGSDPPRRGKMPGVALLLPTLMLSWRRVEASSDGYVPLILLPPTSPPRHSQSGLALARRHSFRQGKTGKREKGKSHVRICSTFFFLPHDIARAGHGNGICKLPFLHARARPIRQGQKKKKKAHTIWLQPGGGGARGPVITIPLLPNLPPPLPTLLKPCIRDFLPSSPPHRQLRRRRRRTQRLVVVVGCRRLLWREEATLLCRQHACRISLAQSHL